MNVELEEESSKRREKKIHCDGRILCKRKKIGKVSGRKELKARERKEEREEEENGQKE